jgi:hypothetical protein
VGLRLWYPFTYSPGLDKQMGYGQVWLDVDLSVPHDARIGRLSNRLIMRMHSVEDDLLYPIMPVVTNNRVRLWIFGQIFHGEADSLLTPLKVTHLYAGLAFQ